MEGKIKNIANRGKGALTLLLWLANVVRYWHANSKSRYNLIHPLHKTAEDKRVKANKKARLAYAKKKAAK